LDAGATGSSAPRQLSPANKEWIASKRRELTQTMWKAAGIVRRKADLLEALQSVFWLNTELTVRTEPFSLGL
jgi:aspartate oxidase